MPLRADPTGFHAICVALLAMALLQAPNLLATGRDAPDAARMTWSGVSVLGLQFWLLWFSAWGRVGLALLLAAPVACLWPLELWLRAAFNTPLTAHFVALAMESSTAELFDLLAALHWHWLLVPLWLAAYALAVVLTWRHRVALGGLVRGILFVAMVGVSVLSAAGTDYRGWLVEGDASERLGPRARHGWSEVWEHVYPVNQLIAWQVYRREQADMQRFRATLAQRPLHATLVAPEAAVDTVVLVIGESSTAGRWSLYGYERPTTPRLQALDLAAFSDVSALSTASRSAIPGVLARRPLVRPDGTLDRDAEPSLVRAFGEAGYTTYWLSNQGTMGFGDSSIAIYAHEARHVRFLNPATYAHRGQVDGVLLPELDAALQAPGRKLIVLHTLGSHFEFAARYPPAFEQFLPAGRPHPGLSQAAWAERIGNSYDNSVLYTDYILSEVVRRVAASRGRSMVAYFSDHGSSVQGTACGPSTQLSRDSYAGAHVPAWFWLNADLRQARSQEWAALQGNRDQPYTTRAMYATLLSLAGITLPGVEQAESFLQRPAARPVRKVEGRDFDEMKRSACH